MNEKKASRPCTSRPCTDSTSPCTDSTRSSSVELQEVNNRSHEDLTADVEPSRSRCWKHWTLDCSSAGCRVVQVLVLSAISLVLLIIYMTPTIFFFIPPLEFVPLSGLITNASVRFPNCSSTFPYTGQICQQELSCFSDSMQNTVNVSVQSQDLLELYVTVLVTTGFPIIKPSPTCKAALRSLTCFYIFGACGADSTQLTTREDCINVRDNLCVREWQEIGIFLGPESFPDCESLPSLPGLSQECNARNDSSFEAVNITQLSCPDGFYFDPSIGICRPECGWSPHLKEFNKIYERVISVFSYVMLLLFSGLNLLLAFTVHRHSVLKVPKAFFVVVSIDSFALGLIILVIDALARRLICEEEADFITNITAVSSVFCSCVGILINYFTLQIAYAMFFYTLFLFWSTVYPFNYREEKNNGRLKYIFLATLIATFVGPLSSLFLLIDGHFSSFYLASVCTARNPTHQYVVITLQLCLLLWVTSSLIVVIIWKIFKNLIINNSGKGSKFGAAHVAELKLITILLYFIALFVVTLAVDAFLTALTPSIYLNALFPYFTCESAGQDLNTDCDKFLSDVQRQDVFTLSVAYIFLLGALPMVVFIFTADFKVIWKRLKTVLNKIKTLAH